MRVDRIWECGLAADQAPELADIRKAGHEGGDLLFIRAAPAGGSGR
jgi:hypothetical protein